MKRAIVTALMVLGAPLALPVAPAQADTPGCVTRGEYYQVHKGVRMKRVHAIFDTRGRWAARGPSKYYRICGVSGPIARHGVQVVYRKGTKGYWRVVAKYTSAE